ncbi:MAG TPA: hypothetical protein VD761_06675 [Solirubrobacterales bacterium]|nr:hypothetical protein [Solirubrobacterales bacterium]
MGKPRVGTGRASGGAIRRALALAGTTAIFAGVIGTGSAVAAAPWGFEQVTPVVKGGGSISYVDTFRTSPDGNTFLYTTNSEFTSLPSEGQPLYMRYIGRRGPDAWSNRSIDPPYDTGGGTGAAINIMGVTRSSWGLGHVIMGSTVARTPGAIEGGGNVYLRDTATGEYTLVAAHENRILSQLFTTNYGAASSQWVAPDGRAAIFNTPLALVPGAPENSDNSTKGGAAYSWTAEDGLEAISVLPESEGGGIVVMSSWGAGNETGPRDSTPRHNGLDHFYFGDMKEDEWGRDVGGVYERTNGETYPISYSRVTEDKTDLKKSYVLSTSDNGEYMLFATKENTPLTADTPPGLEEGEEGQYLGPATFLYRYTQSDKSIEYVGTVNGYTGAFQMTQDGQTIGFQSNAKLTEDATAGDSNVYIWRNGELQLAASLGPGGGKSLNVLSENGRYFSFTSEAATLIEQFDQEPMSEACPPAFGSGPGPCAQVFLFDADATGQQLFCVSCRPDGAAPNGSSGDPLTGNSPHARMDEHQMQTVANDGTTFFTTKDGLLPEDANELEDVYAYKDGELRLLSRARMGMASRFLDATYDGKSVFIATNDPIVGTDTDRSYDIYMTREGAGYPFNPVVPVPPCDGIEACRGANAAPPGAAPSGSAFFQGRPNPSTAPGVIKLAKVATRGPVATLRVKVSGKGRLTASGSGLKKATKATKKAAVYKLQIKLSPKARKALNRKGTLKKKVRVTFTPSEGRASSVARTLTFNAPANGKVN